MEGQAIRILFLSFYIFISAFTYSALALDSEDFSIGLNIIKISCLIFLMIQFKNVKLDRNFILAILFVSSLIITMDEYFMSIGFLGLIIIFNKDLLSSIKVVKTLNRVSLFAILIIFFSSVMGFFRNIIFYDSLGHGLAVRESLGFSNPNPASLLIFSVLVISVYVKDWILLFFSSILFILTLPYLGSRTYLYSILLFCIIYFLSRYKFFRSIFNFGLLLGLVSYPILIQFNIALGYWFVFGVDINSLLSGRLHRISLLYYENGGISLLPSLYTEIVDSGLANILFKFGLLFYLFISYVIFKVIKRTENISFYSLCLVGVFILLSENFITGYILLPLVMFTYIILKRNEKE